ncbi:hypothetical protein [Methanosarcina sp. MTP4]|uniref:hypothetical protein n=1 Tax=Methanosarcina sp. MTP4 TaxID=1434100 RepID=UPI000B211713|nr:hypothetical protein [Methanosarcina sp. MTP4]
MGRKRVFMNVDPAGCGACRKNGFVGSLLNINNSYVSFVRKYGNGRYHFDFKPLEKLVEDEIITLEDAQNTIDAFLENNKDLGENEDIAAVGLSVSP